MSCKYCSHPDYQARGFCSIECRRFFEYEKEIARLRKLVVDVSEAAFYEGNDVRNDWSDFKRYTVDKALKDGEQ